MSSRPPASPEGVIDRILRGVLARPTSVVVATLALTLLGASALLRLPVTLLPSLERPQVVVTIEDPSRSREELLVSAVRPLERRLSSIPQVQLIESWVDDGAASLLLHSRWQTDVVALRIAIQRQASDTIGSVASLRVRALPPDAAPALVLGVLANDLGRATLQRDDVVLPQIARLEDAGTVIPVGGVVLEPVVIPRPAALREAGIGPSALVTALEQIGQTRYLGTVRRGGQSEPIFVRQRVKSLEELAALRISSPGGAHLLGDLADIEWRPSRPFGSFRHDGREVAALEIYRARGANAVGLASEVVSRLSELQAELRPGTELRVLESSSQEVRTSLRDAALAGLVGLSLGGLVLVLALGSLRVALPLLVTVPAAVTSSLLFFLLFDVSLDLISIAGVALAIGLLLDNAIVVLESIETARRGGSARPELDGSRRVAKALLASLLTTMVVFVPLIYLRGIARAFFGVQAFAIVSCLLLSLALALTLVPTLWRAGIGRGARPLAGLGAQRYARLLERWLARPGVTLAAVLGVALVAAGAIGIRIERELLPRSEESGLRAELHHAPGSSPESVANALAQLDELVHADGVCTHATTSLRYLPPSSEHSLDPAGLGRATLDLRWRASSTPQQRRTARAHVVAVLEAVPGLSAELRLLRGPLSDLAGKVTDELEVVATSQTPAGAAALADRALAQLEGSSLTAARRPSGGAAASRELRVDWLVEELASHDLTISEAERQLSQAVATTARGTLRFEGRDAAVLLDPPWTPSTLSRALLEARDGRAVALESVARVTEAAMTAPEFRREGRPADVLEMRVATQPEQLETTLQAVALAPGESLALAGLAREIDDARHELVLALGIAAVLLLLVVAAIYESFAMPFAVLATLPTAGCGAIAALWLSGQTLNVVSGLALILLMGVVVNNSIVLLHRAEELRAADPNCSAPRSAVVRAVGERWRPILLTTSTTIVGLVPLTLIGGEGLEMRISLAVTLGGGLLFGWVGSLLAVPAAYVAFLRPRGRRDSQSAEAYVS